MPATDLLMGTPALSRLSVLPQTVAMEEEPLDSRISDTIRMVYGKTSLPGSTARSERSARWP